MKKRRGESRKILSASIDSTLRMPSGIANRGFGIKKIENKDFKEKTALLTSRYRD